MDICIQSHNPYFNRWFSAMNQLMIQRRFAHGHNPYFNRWFSAMLLHTAEKLVFSKSQSLF